MGWIQSCIDFALQITQLSPFHLTGLGSDGQHPLNLPAQHSIDDSCLGAECALSRPKAFKCSYPELERQGWELCNTNDERDCWIRNPHAVNPRLSRYDIHTDYETETPPGIKREYWLEVYANETVQPDGIEKILGTYFNGTYPGPTLEACWGDELVIHVTNKVPTNGTTIHWHGVRQLNSNEMDGVNGITQCPISFEDHFTYRFRATQYGHTWYHSHYSLQYPDGVAAPLVIHGPTSADWDIDLGPILIADWIHQTAFIEYDTEMGGGVVDADSIVVNGKGHYKPNPSVGSYFQTTFTPGKRHLLKLINGSGGTSFVFSIDGHKLKVIANDLVAIKPFVVDSLFIGIGQRYTVVVEADQAKTDYWIRTVPCAGFSAGVPDNRTAIVRYNSASTAPPVSLQNPQTTCTDTNTTQLHPIVPWYVDQHPQNNVTKDTFFATKETAPDTVLGPPGFPYVHWKLGDVPLWLDFSNPTILDIPHALADPNYIVVEEEFDKGFVYLVMDASKFVAKVTHPIHLHGSDFVILAQENTPWNETTSPAFFNYNNPPRRDVAMLPGGGFLAIAFKPDNPGAWLLHCHIAWHASSGLALQILIRSKDIPDYLGDLRETKRVCNDWNLYPLAANISADQEDSGI
ncbi:multicopper oxidase-domain-containing protein [Xylariales sp. PMI_506]|nr:multicopper oxidase-domain-containing protein [Xylariales sp. PMI_506]